MTHGKDPNPTTGQCYELASLLAQSIPRELTREQMDRLLADPTQITRVVQGELRRVTELPNVPLADLLPRGIRFTVHMRTTQSERALKLDALQLRHINTRALMGIGGTCIVPQHRDAFGAQHAAWAASNPKQLNWRGRTVIFPGTQLCTSQLSFFPAVRTSVRGQTEAFWIQVDMHTGESSHDKDVYMLAPRELE